MSECQLRQSTHPLVGGIHPETHKTESLKQQCMMLPTPPELIFPLHFSGGGPGHALVSVGDRVQQGTPIIQTESGIVHAASRAGVVTAISEHPLAHPSQGPSVCLFIRTDSAGPSLTLPLRSSWTAEALRQRAMEAGILGLGGAGFPSHQKWGDTLHTLLINGAECEPYLTADDTLMQQDADAVIQGAVALAENLNLTRIVIGIEDNKPDALEQLKKAIAESSSSYLFEVVVVPTKYPSGGERQLIWLTLGLEIGSGRRPVDHGIVVHNPGTLAALAHSIDGNPLIERVVTVTGDAVPAPQNVIVPIGTPIRHILNHAGVDSYGDLQLTVGGPLMGFTVHATEAPVVKTTNCLLLRAPTQQPIEPCIRCGLCAEACPVQLQPQRLFQMVSHGALAAAGHEGLADCIECAACNAVCPSHIPLASWFQHGRYSLQEEAQQTAIADQARQRFEARQARLTRLAQEQEARRKARRTQNSDMLAKVRAARGAKSE